MTDCDQLCNRREGGRERERGREGGRKFNSTSGRGIALTLGRLTSIMDQEETILIFIGSLTRLTPDPPAILSCLTLAYPILPVRLTMTLTAATA